MSDSVIIPRGVFDDIVLELGSAIDSIDDIRRLQAALVRAKRMMNDCDPELTPLPDARDHFRNATKTLKKASDEDS
jgi:hypothetical protein